MFNVVRNEKLLQRVPYEESYSRLKTDYPQCLKFHSGNENSRINANVTIRTNGRIKETIGKRLRTEATAETEGRCQRGAKDQSERNARGISRLSQSRYLSLRAADGARRPECNALTPSRINVGR